MWRGCKLTGTLGCMTSGVTVLAWLKGEKGGLYSAPGGFERGTCRGGERNLATGPGGSCCKEPKGLPFEVLPRGPTLTKLNQGGTERTTTGGRSAAATHDGRSTAARPAQGEKGREAARGTETHRGSRKGPARRRHSGSLTETGGDRCAPGKKSSTARGLWHLPGPVEEAGAQRGHPRSRSRRDHGLTTTTATAPSPQTFGHGGSFSGSEFSEQN